MALRKNTDPAPVSETTDEPFTDSERVAAGMAPLNPPSTAPTGNEATFTKAEMQALLEASDPLELLAQMAAAKGKAIESATDVLGDGIVVLGKDMLINKEFFVLEWRFCDGDMGTFSAVKCMDMKAPADQPGRIFVFTDGGMGIHDALVDYFMKRGDTGIIHAPFGLTPSTYDLKDGSGTGTTWRFANAPTKF
jgi:hypothetical protein